MVQKSETLRKILEIADDHNFETECARNMDGVKICRDTLPYFTFPPCFVIPRGLSTLYRCSLTTVAQDKPNHEKSLIRDCFNHKGSCTLFRPYLNVESGISSSSFVRVSTRQLAVSSLSKGIPSTLNFHESIGTDGTRTRNLLHPKRAPYRLSLLDCKNKQLHILNP